MSRGGQHRTNPGHLAIVRGRTDGEKERVCVGRRGGEGEEEEATFSPDDARVAFVRDNNLFAVDAATQRETKLTDDGTPLILNGMMDWVYEEEIYGRGTRRAYWWSPDSSRVAFLRTDDSPVPTLSPAGDGQASGAGLSSPDGRALLMIRDA